MSAIFRLKEGTELTPDLLAKFIRKAKKQNAVRYKKLDDAYKTDYRIFHLARKEKHKPDNRLAVNFAKYIVDTFNGFFIGNPVKTTCDNPKIAEATEFIENYNDQDDNNSELSKLMSIFGRAYEMYFLDEYKKLGITYLSPMESFMIYDESILERPMYFVHWYRDSDGNEVGSFSDDHRIVDFVAEAGTYRFVSETPHEFGDVPATEFIENAERTSIFEPVLSLINSFNKALSEKANDIDYFADAYLAILGALLEDKDKIDLKNQRLINMSSELGEGQLEVKFLEKPSADMTQENFLKWVEKMIYQISMVPNISDENFGTSSGIAMKYKLLNTSNMFQTKQRKFVSGMNRRWKILFAHPVNTGKLSPDDWVKLRYSFTPNMPANLLEEAQTASQLTGITSKQTQLESLSIVDNVHEEMQRIKDEEQEEMQSRSETMSGLFDFPLNQPEEESESE